MYNYIEQAKGVASRLTSSGFSVEAQGIYDAITSGFSGNEIAMAVRYTLKKYLDEGNSIPADIRNDMVIIVTMLNQMLR